LLEQRRHNYVTPTSYLTLLKQFNKLLKRNNHMVNKNIKTYDKGI